MADYDMTLTQTNVFTEIQYMNFHTYLLPLDSEPQLLGSLEFFHSKIL